MSVFFFSPFSIFEKKKVLISKTCCLWFSRKDTLILEKLEAQLKACLCRISFSKAKVGIYCWGQRSLWHHWTLLSGGFQFPSEWSILSFSALAPPSAQPSVLALSLLRHEIESARLEDMLEITCHIQRHLKVKTHIVEFTCLTQTRRPLKVIVETIWAVVTWPGSGPSSEVSSCNWTSCAALHHRVSDKIKIKSQ